MEPTDPLQNLPDELIVNIFAHLEPKELAKLREVSKKMNQIASDDKFLNSAFINPFKKNNITRVNNIKASNPKISNLELAHRLLKSVKADCDHFKISTPISVKNIDLIEQQIKDAILVKFVEIHIDNTINHSYRHTQTVIDAGRQIREKLNAYQGYTEKAKLLREYFLEGSNVTLSYLDGSESNLKKVPEEIGLIKNLWGLFLQYSQLEKLPDSIENLTNLERLYLSNTQLESLPNSIGNLTNLKRLYLSNTQLESLPDSIGNLTNLNTLLLDHTKLEKLPDSIGNLNSLQILSISVTPIKSLPESLKKLTNLRLLSIKNLELDDKSESIIAEMQANNLNLAVNR